MRPKYIGRKFPIPCPRDDIAVQEKRIGLFWDWLRLYYASEEWAEVREKVLAAASGICERCQQAPATDVHHKCYRRAGHEAWGDVEALCRPCHQVKHPYVVL